MRPPGYHSAGPRWTGSSCLVDGDGDALPQPKQGAVDRCRLCAVLGIQHPPHLALADIEVAGEAALRNPGLAPSLVEGRLPRSAPAVRPGAAACQHATAWAGFRPPGSWSR